MTTDVVTVRREITVNMLLYIAAAGGTIMTADVSPTLATGRLFGAL